MRLLVFDPGKTTGWCFLADGNIVGGSFHMWSYVKGLLLKYTPDIVLYESFNLRAGAARHQIGSSFPAVQVIGVIQYLAEDAGLACIAQSPAQRTGITLTRMEGFDRHAKDAMKHGLRYLIKQRAARPYRRYREKRSDASK